ncbi:hypothetical protein VTK56DRAFT_5291 [Thermocarpiscus australiensis]
MFPDMDPYNLHNFLDAVDYANRDYDRALRMHDPDKDSGEFVRRRFDDDFPSVATEYLQLIELTPPQQAADDTCNPTEVEVPLMKTRRGRRRGPLRRPPRCAVDRPPEPQKAAARPGRPSRNAKGVATYRADTSKPQGITKKRRSLHRSVGWWGSQRFGASSDQED